MTTPPRADSPNAPDGTPESLLGRPVLGAWVPTAVAATGTACHVLRAEPIEGESKVLVHVIRLPQGVEAADLLHELEARRRVRHDGVLQLLMSGALDDGRMVIVTPATGASSLATQLAMRPPRLPEVLRIGAQVARAMNAVHDATGVYGPLTPEHVLLTPGADGQDEVRILPVWWAWRHGYDLSEASPWQPVLRADEPRRMADDVYGIGALIWHAIVGRPPRDEDALDTLTGGEPAPPPRLSSQVRRAVPAALDDLIGSLIDPDRRKRPSELPLLAEQLDDLAHQLEGGGAPPIAPPMIMATPVPVGGQLRERSLVLPVAPPAPRIKTPVARAISSRTVGASSVPAQRAPVPVMATEPAGSAPPRSLGFMPTPRTGPSLEDLPTLSDEDDDDVDVTVESPAVVSATDAEAADTPETVTREVTADVPEQSAEAPSPSEASPPASEAPAPQSSGNTPASSVGAPAPNEAPDADQDPGVPTWVIGASVAGVIAISLAAALYLAGVLG